MGTVVVLIAAIAAVFGQALFHGFVYDDFALASGEVFRPPWTRPLTLLTFRLATNAVVAHGINIVLHAVASVLVYRVLLRLIPVRAAQAAALIFALHPIQAEPVNYVWARSTLLMTVSCLMSLRAWLRGAHWQATLWFALALLSKEESVAFPAFLLLLDLSGIQRAFRWRALAVMFTLSAAAGLYVTWAAAVTIGSQAGAHSQYTPLMYLSAQGLAILRYLWLLLVPVGLSVETAIPPGHAWVWTGVIAMALVSLKWFIEKQAGFWVLGGLILLLPSSSIFPANDLAADRRMYLPMVAFSGALGLIPLFQRRHVLAAAALVFGVLSFRQSRHWYSESTLWTRVLQQNPQSVRARIHLARTGDRPAIPTLLEARSLAPEDALVASELGRAYLEQRRLSEALSEFGRALALEPANAQAMANRGVALLMLGQRDAALADFRRALRTDPCAYGVRHNLRQMGLDPDPPPAWCPDDL